MVINSEFNRLKIQKNKKHKVAGLGEVLWDFFPEGKKLGGAPANFAAHAQQLGAESFIISSIGQDVLGKKTKKCLEAYDIDTSGLQVNKDFPTGKVKLTLDQSGNAQYAIAENTAWDHITLEPIHQKIAQKLDALCFGTLAQRNNISQNSIEQIINHTSKNCLKVFDVNFRKNHYDRRTVKKNLDLANVLKVNEEEFHTIGSLFSHSGNHQNRLDSLIHQFDLRLCILTLGQKGSVMASKEQYNVCTSSSTIDVKSTVGAGDAFTAAAVMGWLDQKPLEQINQEASDLAAFVCSHLEAVPKINF